MFVSEQASCRRRKTFLRFFRARNVIETDTTWEDTAQDQSTRWRVFMAEAAWRVECVPCHQHSQT